VLGHVGADFGTVAAGGGADAAVFHVGVVFAFLGATVTNAFAKLAKLLGEIAVRLKTRAAALQRVTHARSSWMQRVMLLTLLRGDRRWHIAGKGWRRCGMRRYTPGIVAVR
jgi:hypothetical protein